MGSNSSDYAKAHYQRNKEKKKAYALLHKEHIKEYRKQYYLKNKDTFRQNQIDYYSIPENRAKRLLRKAKERALKEGLEFNIEISDISIPEYCPYLGVKLTHTLKQGQLETNSSLDRIDSSKGYIKGNIQVISRLANTMKSNATPETLLKFASGIFRVHSGLEGTTLLKYKEAINAL